MPEIPDLFASAPPAAGSTAAPPADSGVPDLFASAPATGGKGGSWSAVFGAPRSGSMADLADLISGKSTGLAAPGSLEDYLRTIPSAANRGAATLLGLPGAAATGASYAGEYLGTGGHDETGFFGPLGRVLNKLHADDARSQLIREESAKARKAFEPITPGGLIKQYETQTGEPLYPPQGSGPKVMGAGLENVMQAPLLMATGVGPVASIAQTALPAAAGEAAGIATQGTPWEVPARLGAALATAGPLALAAIPRGAEGMTGSAVQNMSRAQIQEAFDLMRSSPVRMTFDEAANQITGGQMGRLSDLRRVAEGMGGQGAQPFEAIRAARPGQIQAAGEAGINELAPNLLPPDLRASLGQRAGQGALETVRQGVLNDVRPLYAQAATDVVDPQRMQQVLNRIDALIQANPEYASGLQTLRRRIIETPAQPETTAGLSGRVPATPDILHTNVGTLGDVYRDIRSIHGPDLSPMATNAEKQTRRVTLQGVGELESALSDSSSAFAGANQRFGHLMDTVLTPARQGPLGQIAEANLATPAAGANLGETLVGRGQLGDYAPVTAREVGRVVAQPGGAQAAENLVRDYATKLFGQAIAEPAKRDLATGAGQMGGAKFRAALIGNPDNAANLEAAVRALPNGADRWQGFQNLLDVFEATGYAPTRGSSTAFNQAIQKEFAGSTGVLGASAEQVAQGGLGLKQFIKDKIDQYRIGKNTGELANLLTSSDPGTERLMLQLAHTPSDSARALAITGRLLSVAPRVGRAGARTEPAEATP